MYTCNFMFHSCILINLNPLKIYWSGFAVSGCHNVAPPYSKSRGLGRRSPIWLMVFYICGWRSATYIVCQKKRIKTVVGVHGDTFKFLPAPSDSKYEGSYLRFIIKEQVLFTRKTKPWRKETKPEVSQRSNGVPNDMFLQCWFIQGRMSI